MDLRILEIASHTENNKILENFTHKSKNKNPLCGDIMEISLIVKNDIVKDMGYQCKSCVYCQASVSLLSRNIKNKKINEIKNADFLDEKNDVIKQDLLKLYEINSSEKEIFEMLEEDEFVEAARIFWDILIVGN